MTEAVTFARRLSLALALLGLETFSFVRLHVATLTVTYLIAPFLLLLLLLFVCLSIRGLASCRQPLFNASRWICSCADVTKP